MDIMLLSSRYKETQKRHKGPSPHCSSNDISGSVSCRDLTLTFIEDPTDRTTAANRSAPTQTELLLDCQRLDLICVLI